MKTIDVDEELYRYIASHTQRIGESASDILRRLLKVDDERKSAITTHSTAPLRDTAEKPVVDQSRSMYELLLSDEYTKQNKVVNRFMLILSTLYSINALSFKQATELLHGRTRIYFASDQQTLMQNGKHTKPKLVAGTPYWVITNTNSGRKRAMIEHIMQSMQFPAELIEKVCSTI